jgi:hypothetical protein
MLVLLIWQLIRSFSIDTVLQLSISIQFIDRYLTLLSFKMYLYPNTFYKGRLQETCEKKTSSSGRHPVAFSYKKRLVKYIVYRQSRILISLGTN